jgi:hypothetical protein
VTTPASDALVSEAVALWLGWGVTSWPQRDEGRLAARFGAVAAADLLPLVRAWEEDFYASDSRLTARNLVEMGGLAAEEFRSRRPGATETAVEALAWAYTYDYK